MFSDEQFTVDALSGRLATNVYRYGRWCNLICLDAKCDLTVTASATAATMLLVLATHFTVTVTASQHVAGGGGGVTFLNTVLTTDIIQEDEINGRLNLIENVLLWRLKRTFEKQQWSISLRLLLHTRN